MAEPPAKRHKPDMSKTFTAVVGEERKEFTLYTDIAARSSKFFQAALSKDWQEALEKRVTLKEVTAINFESYLRWLSTNDTSYLDEIEMLTATQLYILGDFLDDSAFRIAMLKVLIRQAINKNLFPSETTVALAWEQTPEDSPLRKMAVEMLTIHGLAAPDLQASPCRHIFLLTTNTHQSAKAPAPPKRRDNPELSSSCLRRSASTAYQTRKIRHGRDLPSQRRRTGQKLRDARGHRHPPSSFFKATLSHDWKEAQEKHILVPDCEPEIFEGYLQWIYTHEVAYYTKLLEQTLELVKLWIVGDFLGDQNFCDAVVGGLFSHKTVAGPDAIKHLYDHTPHDSHLRWYVFNIWAMRYSVAHIADLFATERTYPKNFIIDLFMFFAEYDRVFDRLGWVPPPYSARAMDTVVAADDEE